MAGREVRVLGDWEPSACAALLLTCSWASQLGGFGVGPIMLGQLQ